MKNKIYSLLARMTTVTMLVTSVFNFAPAHAAALTAASDTMTRIATAVTADHTIVATLPTGVTFDPADEMTYTWGTAFTSGGTWAAADFTFDDGGAVTIDDIVQDAGGIPVCSGAVDAVAIGIDTDNGNIRVLACSSYTDSAAAATITFTIDGTTTGGTLTNPATSDFTLTVGHSEEGTPTNSVGVGLSIVDSDQVTVTATVDPTITFDLDVATAHGDSDAPYAVDLGTLTIADVEASGTTDGVNAIFMDIDTNATSGVAVTVQNVNGTSGLVSTSVGADSIANAAATMAAGTENYGLCVAAVSATTGTLSKAGNYTAGTCALDGNTNEVKALSTTAAAIVSSAAPIEGGSATIAVNAAISAVTKAHDDYTDTLTFIATGTF